MCALFAQVLVNLKHKGIAIRVASPKLVMEEAPESYKVPPPLPCSSLLIISNEIGKDGFSPAGHGGRLLRVTSYCPPPRGSPLLMTCCLGFYVKAVQQ